MYRIVHSAIHQVSQYKTREKHECILSHDQIKQAKDGRRNYNTWNRGHEQPLFVSRVMMMIPVKCVNELLSPFAFSHPMKKETMGQIFKKGPKEHTTYKREADT